MMNSHEKNAADTALLSADNEETLKDLNQVFAQEQSPSEIFFEIANHLREKYDINKAVLVIRQDDSSLAAISTWNNGQKRDGLSLNLPQKESLFEKVIEDGRLYTEYFSESFSGNFFEQKLLLDNQSRSFALKPLKVEGKTVGLVGFSSQNPTAFTVMNEGETDKLLSRFATTLVKKSPRT